MSEQQEGWNTITAFMFAAAWTVVVFILCIGLNKMAPYFAIAAGAP